MVKINDIYAFLDELAPFSSQQPWDNSGFLVGDGAHEVKKVLMALDVTEEVLNEAEKKNADLVVSHHPVLFTALKQFHPKDIIFLAAEKGIGVISSHTCLDVANGGVNDCLAEVLGLNNVHKIGDELGLIRMGELDKEMSCREFAKYVADRLSVGGVKYTNTEKAIRKVAVCGGSGAEFYGDALRAGADAYVTANIKHNQFLEIKRANFCVLDAGHFCTENTVIKPLGKKIKARFPEIEVEFAETSKDPAEYYAK